MFESINPKNFELIKKYNGMEDDEVEQILSEAQKEFNNWKNTGFQQRSDLMLKLASLLKRKVEPLAELITNEMGKVISESRSEILKCASLCQYYAERSEEFLRNQKGEASGLESMISFQPLGIILSIMPWNFPFWQALRFAVPSIMAGNACLLKHAPNVCGSALEIEKLFWEAGFPENIFRTLIIDHEQTANCIDDPRVMAISLTGSTRAGKIVASHAASRIKKAVLELGGSDPYLILEDADLELAIDKCISSRMINAGQSCVAAKRFITVGSIHWEFLEGMIRKMDQLSFGDPLEEVDFGPLARRDLRDQLHQQVTKSQQLGAEAHIGGEIPKINGAFYRPTVISNVSKGMPAFDEELFGPVATIIQAKSEAEAINIANSSRYGLGAGVFTRDIKKGVNIAENYLEAGNCFVNDFVKSHPALPFGGIKESGYGRELGLFGIREFVNIKTVVTG